eukprot:GEMP01029902.1.p1 GENE.GEMP01029902.1~~GEMP01029902.1.p1  ORF type:complete len:465 (+),score=54.38 GEMP01029902.1:192-1586(+)
MSTRIECTAIEGNPQQIRCCAESLEFCSQFDGGNLSRVERRGRNDFNLYVHEESSDQTQCGWFYFSIKTTFERNISLFIRNLNNQSRLFGQGGHRPVYKNEEEWRRIPAHEWIGCNTSSSGCTVRFRHKLLRGTTYFAFCYPYSYEECQKTLNELEEQHPTVLKRELLCNSILGRSIDVVTVGNEPLQGKPHVLATARVHPGETPSQFMLFGMLRFLLSDSPTAKMLRETLVFKFVPMLNPDGVYLGKYRTNSYGYNLNRFYQNPQSEHEAIGSVKKLASSLPSLVCYLDFHAHANKRGAFCYGNNLADARLCETQREFMKNIAACTSYFDASMCNFNPSNCTVKDKRCVKDSETTEGSSRVQLFYAIPHLSHSYTIETHYSTDQRHRPMGPAEWEHIGAGVAKAIFSMDFPNRNCSNFSGANAEKGALQDDIPTVKKDQGLEKDGVLQSGHSKMMVERSAGAE